MTTFFPILIFVFSPIPIGTFPANSTFEVSSSVSYRSAPIIIVSLSSYPELRHERTPITECSIVHSLSKQPSEMIASLILHFSNLVGGKYRGEVKKGVFGS
uniref:Secreted protein n=1 Tax=Arundo donax TaxID=35708 RepID=A0A0A9DD21_ARUDO